MRKVDQKLFKNPKQHIPQGIYCYNDKGICPFWDLSPAKPHQENGYCHYLQQGDDDEEHFGLLWDQVKECGVNDDFDLPEDIPLLDVDENGVVKYDPTNPIHKKWVED